MRGVSPQNPCRAFSRRVAPTSRSGCGEAGDECGERVTPNSGFLGGWHHPAELDRGESFAEGVKLAGGVTYRSCTTAVPPRDTRAATNRLCLA
jgi:hypothetical protein